MGRGRRGREGSTRSTPPGKAWSLAACACRRRRCVLACQGRNKKGSLDGCLPCSMKATSAGRFGRALAGIALLELVDAAGRVDDLLFAGIEGMGLGGDLDLVDRILLPVLPFDGFVGRDRR